MILKRINAETFNNGASNSGSCGLGTIINGLIDAANMTGGDKNVIEITSSDSAADILKTLESAQAGDKIVIKSISDNINLSAAQGISIADGVEIDGGGNELTLSDDVAVNGITFGKGCVIKNISFDLGSAPTGQDIAVGEGSFFENVYFPQSYNGLNARGCTLI